MTQTKIGWTYLQYLLTVGIEVLDDLSAHQRQPGGSLSPVVCCRFATITLGGNGSWDLNPAMDEIHVLNGETLHQKTACTESRRQHQKGSQALGHEKGEVALPHPANPNLARLPSPLHLSA